MTRFKAMFVFVAGVVAVTGCASLPEYAAPKFRDEYNAEMADFIPYRKLERADFKAEQPPAEFSEHAELMAAVICVFIKPVIDQEAIDIELSNPPNEEQVYRITYRNLRYRALMDRNCSWWNSKTVANDERYILEHEQIHFALAELGARRGHESTSVQINVKLGSPEAMTESVQKQLKRYLKELHESVMAQDRKFDEETSVVHDPDKQKQWWNLVQSQLSDTTSVGALPDSGFNEAAPEEGEQLTKYGGYEGVLKLIRPLAEQGHIKAQHALGWMYRTGKGVTQDYEAAVKWYKRAAQQGYAKAQASLGWMYHTGRGVDKDNIRAFMWLSNAVSEGLASYELKLELVQEEMTDADIYKSRELLNGCRAKAFKDC